ncbi:MAG TPA: hypothetical protein VKZ60_06610 [Chloroflexota bacterium]|nr:hypothetical protein [Chloroflexota bacterium]
MSTLAERAEQELNAILAQYAAGEAEVVRAFFARPRSRDELADMVRRQMGREVFCVGWLERAVRQGRELERTVDRHAFVELLEQIADELRHYALLADLVEWLLGRQLGAEEAREYEVYAVYDPDVPLERQYNPRLPEANAMLDLLRDLRARYPTAFTDAVMRLTEGGGGGAFQEASGLAGDEFRERFARAMGRIVEDELEHGPLRVRGFVQQWIRDEADLALAKELLRRFMAQHLRVRNEIYGYPLSAERLAAIDRGEITPWALPTPSSEVPA